MLFGFFVLMRIRGDKTDEPAAAADFINWFFPTAAGRKNAKADEDVGCCGKIFSSKNKLIMFNTVAKYLTYNGPNLIILVIYSASFTNIEDATLITFGYCVILFYLLWKPARIFEVWQMILLYACMCVLVQLIWNMNAFEFDRQQLHQYKAVERSLWKQAPLEAGPFCQMEAGLLNQSVPWSNASWSDGALAMGYNTSLPYNGEFSVPYAAWLNITGLRTQGVPEPGARSARSDDLLLHFSVILAIIILINFMPKALHQQATQDIFCGNWGGKWGERQTQVESDVVIESENVSLPRLQDAHPGADGAWPHLSEGEVRSFGRVRYAAANFFLIHGEILRWIILLIAAASVPYSLASIYLIAMFEHRFSIEGFRKRFVVFMMAWHLSILVLAMVHHYYEADECSDAEAGLKSVLYVVNRQSAFRGEWKHILSSHPLNFQSFVVLYVWCQVMSATEEATNRLKCLHWTELTEDLEAVEKLNEDAALRSTKARGSPSGTTLFAREQTLAYRRLRRCTARLVFFSEQHIIDPLRETKNKELRDPTRASLPGGIMTKECWVESRIASDIMRRGLARYTALAAKSTERNESRCCGNKAKDGLPLDAEECQMPECQEQPDAEELANHMARAYLYPGRIRRLVIEAMDSYGNVIEHKKIAPITVAMDQLAFSTQVPEMVQFDLESAETQQVPSFLRIKCLERSEMAVATVRVGNRTLERNESSAEVKAESDGSEEHTRNEGYEAEGPYETVQPGVEFTVFVITVDEAPDGFVPNRCTYTVKVLTQRPGATTGITQPRGKGEDGEGKGSAGSVEPPTRAVSLLRSKSASLRPMGGGVTPVPRGVTHVAGSPLGHKKSRLFTPHASQIHSDIRWQLFAENASCSFLMKTYGNFTTASIHNIFDLVGDKARMDLGPVSNGSVVSRKLRGVLQGCCGCGNERQGQHSLTFTRFLWSFWWMYFIDIFTFFALCLILHGSVGKSLIWMGYVYGLISTLRLVFRRRRTAERPWEHNTHDGNELNYLHEKRTKQIKQQVDYLLVANFIHLVLQSLYHVFESFQHVPGGGPSGCLFDDVYTSEVLLAKGCISTAKRRSILDNLFWTDEGTDPDRFGELLGLDNDMQSPKTTETHNFSTAIILFVVLSFCHVAVRTEAFSDSPRGALFLRYSESHRQKVLRRFLQLVVRLQKRSNTTRKFLAGIDNVRIEYDDLNRSSEADDQDLAGQSLRAPTAGTWSKHSAANTAANTSAEQHIKVTGAGFEGVNGEYFPEKDATGAVTHYEKRWSPILIQQDSGRRWSIRRRGIMDTVHAALEYGNDEEQYLCHGNTGSFERHYQHGALEGDEQDTCYYYNIMSSGMDLSVPPRFGWQTARRSAATPNCGGVSSTPVIDILHRDDSCAERCCTGMFGSVVTGVRKTVQDALAAKHAHLAGHMLQRRRSVDQLNSAELMCIILEGQYMSGMNGFFVLLSVGHVIVHQDLLAVAPFLAVFSFQLFHYPNISDRFWNTARRMVMFEIFIRYVLCMDIFTSELFTACAIDNVDELPSECSFVDDVDQFWILILLLVACLHMREINLRSGLFSQSKRGPQEEEKAISAQDLDEETTAECVYCDSIAQMNQLKWPKNPQLAKGISFMCRDGERSSAAAHFQESSFKNLWMCSSCGSLLQKPDLDASGMPNTWPPHIGWYPEAPEQAETEGGKGREGKELVIMDVHFDPARLEGIYEEEEHIEQAFVWARVRPTGTVLVAVIVPSLLFWNEQMEKRRRQQMEQPNVMEAMELEQDMLLHLREHVRRREESRPYTFIDKTFGRWWGGAEDGMRVPDALHIEQVFKPTGPLSGHTLQVEYPAVEYPVGSNRLRPVARFRRHQRVEILMSDDDDKACPPKDGADHDAVTALTISIHRLGNEDCKKLDRRFVHRKKCGWPDRADLRQQYSVEITRCCERALVRTALAPYALHYADLVRNAGMADCRFSSDCMGIKNPGWSITAYVKKNKEGRLDPEHCDLHLVLRSLVIETENDMVDNGPRAHHTEEPCDLTKDFQKLLYFDYSGGITPQKMVHAKRKVRTMMATEQDLFSDTIMSETVVRVKDQIFRQDKEFSSPRVYIKEWEALLGKFARSEDGNDQILSWSDKDNRGKSSAAEPLEISAGCAGRLHRCGRAVADYGNSLWQHSVASCNTSAESAKDHWHRDIKRDDGKKEIKKFVQQLVDTSSKQRQVPLAAGRGFFDSQQAATKTKTRAVVKRNKVKITAGYDTRIEYKAGDFVISDQGGWACEYRATERGWDKEIVSKGVADLETEDLRIMPKEKRVRVRHTAFLLSFHQLSPPFTAVLLQAIADWPNVRQNKQSNLDLLVLHKDHLIVAIECDRTKEYWIGYDEADENRLGYFPRECVQDLVSSVPADSKEAQVDISLSKRYQIGKLTNSGKDQHAGTAICCLPFRF